MRIEKINPDKIKVLIDDTEAKQWQVSFKNISENTPQAQKMVWAVIRTAEKHAGFFVNDAKLFIEAVDESADGGFGMMITRVANADELEEAIRNCSYRGRVRHASLKMNVATPVKKRIYRFSDFEGACMAAGEVREIYDGESVFYKYNEEFYLYLTPESEKINREIEMILGEFGEEINNGQYMHGRLNEYGETLIAEKAIEILQEYFCVK